MSPETTRNELDDRTIDEWQQGVPHPDDRPVDTETVTSPDASQEAQAACQDTESDTSDGAQKKTLNGGLDPREMASRRWAKERARAKDENEQAAHEQRQHAVVVRTTVQVGDIVRSLAAAAKKGNTQAAKELRAYLAEFPVETDTDVSALDRRVRQALLAFLMDERLLAAYEDGSLAAFLDERQAA